MRGGLFLILLAAAGFAGGSEGAAQRWTRHVTTAGFSVDRPPGWTAVGVAPDRFSIRSGRCREPALATCDGVGEILVSSEPFGGKPARIKACWNLTETVSEAEDGPGRRTEVSQLSCTIGARRFFIVERHWKGDKHAARYSRIAMRMAKSLRYPG